MAQIATGSFFLVEIVPPRVVTDRVAVWSSRIDTQLVSLYNPVVHFMSS